MNIAEIRAQYPQYDDLSDEQLATGLHQKFYSDMPFEEFANRAGLAAPAAPVDQFSPGEVIRAKGAQGIAGSFGDELKALGAAPAAALINKFQDRPLDVSMVDLYYMQRAKERERLAAMQAEHPTLSTVSEVGGSALGLGKLGAATYGASQGMKQIPRWAASGAVPGAVVGAGASEADYGSPEFMADVGTGAALGGAMGIAIPLTIQKAVQIAGPPLKRIFDRVVGNMRPMQIYDDAGKLTDEAIDELGEIVARGDVTPAEADAWIQTHATSGAALTPEQAVRWNRFREYGVTPTKANITQATDDWKATQEMAKSTGKVSNVMGGQSRQMEAAAQRTAEAIGEVAEEGADAGYAVYRHLTATRTAIDDAVDAAYAAARQAGANKRGTLGTFARVLQSNRGNKQISGGVVESAKAILKDKGLIKIDKAIETTKRARGIRGTDLKKIGVNEMQEIRVALNDLWDSATPKGKRIIRELTHAIDDDVANVVGKNIFGAANAAKATERRLLNKAVGSKWAKTGKSLIQKIFFEDIPPAKILSATRNATRGDLSSLKRYLFALDDEMSQAGHRAWDNFRAQHVKQAMKNALRTMGKVEGGEHKWSVSAFKSYWQSFKDNKTYSQIFNESERKMIDDIMELGWDMVPQGNVERGLGPSAQAVESGVDLIISHIPFAGKSQKLLRALFDLRTNTQLTSGFMKATEEALR